MLSRGRSVSVRVVRVARRLMGRSWGCRARRSWGVGARGLGVSSAGSWGAGGLASPGCPGTSPVRGDLESVQTVSAPLAGVVRLGAKDPAGGECACAVGDCCRACGLVAALRQGRVMRRICLGHGVYAVLCCLCGVVRSVGRDVLQSSESVDALSLVSLV